MSPKENPGLGTEGFKESSCAATSEQSHDEHPNASEKSSQGQRKQPRPGTQIAIVAELLRSRPGQFVGVDEIMRHARCAASHSVISTLRKKYAFRIRNRLRRSKGGVMLSEYSLEGKLS